MLNSDFGYPSLVPARPTYLPVCDCHTDSERNEMFGTPPDMILNNMEYAVETFPELSFVPDKPYLFRSQLSWSLTPIGER